ncbi:MAG: hypothetical protein ACI9A1_001608 [Lentimonas sp.]|jgi:hypothetical protein
MIETNELQPNTFFIEVSGSGLPEVDGLRPYPKGDSTDID